MKILDLLFPSGIKCIFCGCECGGYAICPSCEKSLPIIEGRGCIKCGGKLHGEGEVCLECKQHTNILNGVFSICEYDGIFRSKIISYKNGNKYLGETFSKMMYKKFENIDIPIDMVIPVPSHENRIKERAFDHVKLLVSDIERNYGRVNYSVLERVIDTPHQTGLDRENRLSNLERAFKVMDRKSVKGKTILLVDDIYTTGSTLNACAEKLFKAGAYRVYGLVLGRKPIDMSSVVH